MGTKKLSPNARCPCGSGRKYKACCFDKGFHYLVDDDGSVYRTMQMNPESVDMLKQVEAEFIAKHGRPPGPGDRIFQDLPDEETLTNEVCAAMEEAGTAPALVYAFRKTGLLLTTENRHMVPTADVEEFEAAVEEYYDSHPEEDDGLDA
ncbi:MAG: SEC-C metal-binding domain-containing protein [Myxococcaceae bacterium]